MKTTPIINVSNAMPSAPAAKVGNASSSEQSFGQVLSREVHDRSNADNNPPSKADSNANDSQTKTTVPSSATPGKAVKSKSVDDKTKQATDADASASASAPAGTAADTSNTNGSAQILALVANVQQADSNGNNNIAPSATNSVSSISGDAASGLDAGALSALHNFQIAATDNDAAVPADSAALSTAAERGLPKAATSFQDLKLTSEISQQTNTTAQLTASNASAANVRNEKPAQPTASMDVSNAQNGDPAVPPLDLSAVVEKDVQAGLSALDSAGIKNVQAAPTVPDTPPIVALQQAALGVQIPANNPNDKLTPQVGSAGWDQALGQKVVWMVAGGQQSASLTLNPPDLGPMQVVLNVNNSHATATFTAAQPEVRQALEAAMPKLREMLGEAGIQLGQTSVNSGAAQQQTPSNDQNSRQSSRTAGTFDSAEVSMTATRAVPTGAGLGLVDTFA